MCLCKFLFNWHYNQTHFRRKLYYHKYWELWRVSLAVMYLLQYRWLWCHSSKWFIKHSRFIQFSWVLNCLYTFARHINSVCDDSDKEYNITNVIWILLKVFNVFVIYIFSTQFWPHCMTLLSCCLCQYVNTCQFTRWWDNFLGSWHVLPLGKWLLYGSLYAKNLFIELWVMQFCIMPPSI